MCFSSHFPPKNIPARSFPISPFENSKRERRPIDDLGMHIREKPGCIFVCVRPGRVYSKYGKDFENMNLDLPGQSIL
ncbi:hypothetical protein CEXT_290201 [Caerostris extrusa]|uniref:Uncharacterized protein n=1 Tax=Caerostris extrusa TaxID=172846 RepID=A0AAV4QPK0_CAEEX|nr:hypothetical protein CEXT_290201 [Caerostris extrusa]